VSLCKQKRSRRTLDKELSDSNSSLRDLRADIMKSCFNALDAMHGWEHVL
jgi:hypothetical protein